MLLEQVVLSLGHVSTLPLIWKLQIPHVVPHFFFWYVINFIEK